MGRNAKCFSGLFVFDKYVFMIYNTNCISCILRHVFCPSSAEEYRGLFACLCGVCSIIMRLRFLTTHIRLLIAAREKENCL